MLRKYTILWAVSLCSSFSCLAADDVQILEYKIYESPFITEEVALNKPFDLYVTKGAKVSLLDEKQRLEITLNKMTILCVQSEDECIGDQFAFDFSARLQKQSEDFRLIMNEPQNMELSELDIEKNEIALFSDYTITIYEMNFSISKNSITLRVSK